MHYINQLIAGDCGEVLQKLPDNSIDLIFTCPGGLSSYSPNPGTRCWTPSLVRVQRPWLLSSWGAATSGLK